MVYHYLDAATGEEIEEDPTARTYSIMELVREHEKRFIFKTEAGGALVLRYLPLRMKRIIDSITGAIYPNAKKQRRELAEIAEGIRGLPKEEVPEEIAAEIIRRSAEYRIVAQYYALGVIEEPRCSSMEDIDAIYTELTEPERDALDMLIQELARARQPEEIDDSALTIADRYKVQIIDKDMLESMTVSQADFFLKSIDRENIELARLMKEKR